MRVNAEKSTRESILNKFSGLKESFRTIAIDDEKSGNSGFNTTTLISELADNKSTPRKRITSGLRLINKLTRGKMGKVMAPFLKYSLDEVSVDPNQYNVPGRVGWGFTNHVFLLESKQAKNPSYVLKVGRKKIGNGTVDKLVERAQRLREEVNTITKEFSRRPEMVPQEFYFIGQSTTGENTPCIGSIQEFYGRSLRDLFTTDPRELKNLYLRFPEFASDINYLKLKLTEDSSQLVNSTRWIDLIGKGNISIVEREDGPHVVVLDAHFQYFSDLGQEGIDPISQKIGYISEITNV